MTSKRTDVHIDTVVVDATEGADPAVVADEVRAGISRAFAGGIPRSFKRDSVLLQANWTPARRGAWDGLGAAIAGAKVPAVRKPR